MLNILIQRVILVATIKTRVCIQPAQVDQIPEIVNLLDLNDLDSSDLDNVQLFTASIEGLFAGIIGFECYESSGLIRSLAVKNEFRKQNLGKNLVEHALKRCQEDGITDLYLLTNTAAKYFTRFGFLELERVDVPDQIKQSRQFSEFCPDTATVMVLNVKRK